MAAALPCYVGLRGRRVKLPNRAQRIRRLFDVNDDVSRDVCEAGHHREMAPALRASRRGQGPPARFSSSTYAVTARPAERSSSSPVMSLRRNTFDPNGVGEIGPPSGFVVVRLDGVAVQGPGGRAGAGATAERAGVD